MTNTLDAVRAKAFLMLTPPPRLNLSEWADANFLLPQGDANAGRWRCLPYQRGWMDTISDPAVERVTIMKSARVGYTKTFCATVGYYIEHDPCPIMIVQPTLTDAQNHSKEDIAPMLEEIPVLAAVVAPPKTRTSANTILEKQFRGGTLSLVGANSPRGFRRTSRRVVIFDEVDGYPLSAGTEGDQVALGIRRTEYYWNRKILMGSTPTIAGYSRIESLFAQGDQRRYHVPCPVCGHRDVLVFRKDTTDRGHFMVWPDQEPHKAHFVCRANGCYIGHEHKRTMIEAGTWVPDAPDHFTERNRHASFHIWAAYSYSPNATWADIATEFLDATKGGPLQLKTFINTALGETWKDRGEAPEWERLAQRREPYPIGTVPRGALFLTAGVDVQKDRLVVEVVGWGRDKTSWSVDYLVFLGDTANRTALPWTKLDALLAHQYPTTTDGTTLPITLLAVDSGYNTQTVYAWARRYPMARVIAVKGQHQGFAMVATPTPVELNHYGRRLKRGYKVWTVATNMVKSELYGWLRLPPPLDGAEYPPGFVHFPEYDQEYFRQLTAEQLIPVRDRLGRVRLEWATIPGRENHVLDCRVYARAAASVVGIDRLTDDQWRALERAAGYTPTPTTTNPVPAQPAHVQPVHRPARRGWVTSTTGWIKRR